MPPTALINSISGIRSRIKFLSVAFGVGIVLAALVAIILGTVLVDYSLNLPPVPRLLLLAIGLAAVVYVAVRFVWKPVQSRLSLSDVAGHLENVFPQFDDRLRSTVDFVEKNAIPGSDYMKERTVAQATEIAGRVDLSKAVVTKPVWYSVSSAVGLVTFFVALSILVPSFKNIGLARLFAPFANIHWPKTVLIDAQPLPKRVPVGQRIDVSMLLKKGDKASQKATIYYQYDNGPVQKEYMIRGDNGRYAASIDARAGSEKLTVWMASGDDETTKEVIQVVPRLAIGRVDATITPPTYANMDPITMNLGNAPAFMTIGSNVSLTIAFNKELDTTKPVTLFSLTNAEQSASPATQPSAPTGPVAVTAALAPNIKYDLSKPGIAVVSFTAKDSFRFRISATDKDGFTNNGLEEYELAVKPDQLPTVQIESPRKNVDRTPDAYLPLQILAEDDFGLSSMKLIVDRINGDRKQHWELPMKDWVRIDGTGERQRFRLNRDWEFKATLGELKPGDVLEYFVEVVDNYRIESQENGKAVTMYHPPQYSSKLRVNIISQEEMAVRITDEIRALGQKTRTVQNTQISNQNETRNLQEDTKNKPELTKGDKAALEGVTSRQSAMVSQAKSLAGQLEDVKNELKENKVADPELNSITKDAKDALDQAAEKPMTDAANQLNQAQQAKTNSTNPEQQKKVQDARNQSLQQSEKSQQDAANKLEQAIQMMDKVGNLGQMIKEVQKDLARQTELKNELKDIAKDNLGKKPEDMKPEDRKRLEENVKEQKKLADETRKLVEKMQKMGDQMNKSDPQTAQAMKDAAQQAQSQQISQQQQNAAQQAQQNQQAQAQNAQQQAELGLQVVLNTLKDAERRKLEQLAKLLDKLIDNIQDLVRRQAGHNIDNLINQGGDALAKAMTKEEMEVLFAKAKRDLKNPGKVELGVLTSGQEQTERNTRNIAKSGDEVPEAAAAAADLVRAAGKMGYAIVELRDKKLTSAYNPNQVEALNALEQALKKAEDERAKVEAKKNQQAKEAIRAQFEKIRQDQLDKINKPTSDIDSTRKPDGTLARENAVRLNQLPGEQGNLGKRVSDLTDELAKLESIVYVWAGKDIADSMNEVKSDLGKQKTGKPVQQEETRIIEQLDAMIASLKQEMDKSKFDQKGGGGGGGGGTPKSKLPTEAELRLLKALQNAINKNTIDADKLAKEQQDKVALVNLGNRQGQLRGLLDKLLQKATEGKEGLKPEPDPKDKLPEEAGKEQIENQETQDELLGGKPDAEKETKQLNRVGDRMARSRQRLALDNDPGKITQEIQKRIVVDIDDLIKQAQQQQANSQPKPGQKPGDKPGEKPGEGQQPGQQNANGQGSQSQPNTSSTAANNSTVSQAGKPNTDLSQQINETAREWGAISPRLRDAVIEGATEQVPVKYRKLIEDYYRGMSTGGKQP